MSRITYTGKIAMRGGGAEVYNNQLKRQTARGNRHRGDTKKNTTLGTHIHIPMTKNPYTGQMEGHSLITLKTPQTARTEQRNSNLPKHTNLK